MTAAIPQGWRVISLSEVGDFLSGGTPDRSNSSYWGGDIPWVTAKDLKSFYLHDSIERLSKSGSENGSRTVPPDSILVLVRGMTLLKDVPVAVITRAMAFNQDVKAIRVNNQHDAKFIAYCLVNQKEQLRSFVDVAGHGTGRLATELLQSLPVKAPPRPEQNKIAAILSEWDRAIELTEKLIATKERRNQALMHQLLTGRRRLSKFGKSEQDDEGGVVAVPAAMRRGVYPPSVQPGIPKIDYRPSGWEETTMGKLLQIEKRPIELQENQTYQLVVAKRNRGGIEPREQLLGKEIKTPTQFAVHEGDFVISRRQIIHGACGVVPPALDGAIVSNEYAVCRVKEALDIDFLKYLSHTLYFQQTCFHASVGVAIEKMIFQLDRWLSFPFVIPPIAEQKAIAAVLTTQDREIDILQGKWEALRRQKKGLMQQLLAGKVRVKVPDEPPGG